MYFVLKNLNIEGKQHVCRDENHVTKKNSADLGQSSNDNWKASIHDPDYSFQLFL